MTRFLLRATLTLAIGTLAACGGNTPANPTTPTPPTSAATVSTITVTGASSLTTFQLTATAGRSDGTTQDVTKDATWASSDPAQATVSAGMVTVVGTGDFDVRATFQGVTGSLHLLAARVSVVGVTIGGAPAGGTFQLSASAQLSNGSTQDVTRMATWASSNTGLATVSVTGYVTVVSTGDVDVRATFMAVTGSSHLTVTLPKGFTLSGVVTEIAPNVRPIVGASVRLLSGGSSGRIAVTDASGAFALTAVPTGRVLIEVTSDGYRTWETEVTVVDRDLQLVASLHPTPAK